MTDYLEIYTRLPEPKKPLHSKYYLDPDERRLMIQECGDAAVLQYELYLRLSAVGDKTIEDQAVADYFGWPVSKVKRIRRDLTRHHWFLETRFSLGKNRKGVTYYLGKTNVTKVLHEEGVLDSPAPVTGFTRRIKPLVLEEV